MKNHTNIGLALGGGAVLGAAHVGVLRAMEEFDIKVKYITGTSIGAFVAAFVAFGKTWDEIEQIASELKWMDITRVTLSKYGLLSNEKLGNLIIKHIGDKNIEDADIPLAMIATNIETGEKVILDKGSVAEAAMASTCIPGIFKPVEINGNMLVDGGIVENVPINTVKNMGADFVIGVDLNAKHSYKKPDNIIDVLLNSFHFIMKHSVKHQTEYAHMLIEPNLAGYNMADMDQVQDLMKKGYSDAKKAFEKKLAELNLE
ncbi:patatin-like phospholipase family protein [Plebeiibacterium sediminum]|uniref:Patatin-like phospholipase family protein n=1 Tax=Plebeiibacterium sediminum TaxID=2992112 RepID=A0AAE3M2R0_9BACT|nr:patatin-like phospholipase family protein [Plebeiobacterium sediminum]MCW3785757.1 patatin-like phospholipase family protein [Plebeiobacterium sediminum]